MNLAAKLAAGAAATVAAYGVFQVVKRMRDGQPFEEQVANATQQVQATVESFADQVTDVIDQLLTKAGETIDAAKRNGATE